ncbi:MAG: DUF4417 domain-containing protein [Lachnospiraceae bacterium]|nr:DUF4417 domain-containing protein [Lachnospiraceae bacterium]
MENSKIITRAGCKDIWNSFMVSEASFDIGSDLPICVSTDIIPNSLISYEDAKAIYKKEAKRHNADFYVDSFIHFYIDDYKFDGKRTSIWTFPDKALDVIRHFAGIISPDFSTYADFPTALKQYNTYRMRAFGCWMNALNIPVINNVRWGTYETWGYCFAGIPKGSSVAIGTVASGIRKIENRPAFEEGLKKMISVIAPKRIIIYGSSNYVFLSALQELGVEIISIPSKTSLAYQAVSK